MLFLKEHYCLAIVFISRKSYILNNAVDGCAEFSKDVLLEFIMGKKLCQISRKNHSGVYRNLNQEIRSLLRTRIKEHKHDMCVKLRSRSNLLLFVTPRLNAV